MSDAIVIGAGVIGASIAFHLAREGAWVALFDDPDAPKEPSASWASAGGVRSQNRDPRESQLTVAAAARWPSLAADLNAETGFRRGGHLHVIERGSDLTALRERIERERAAGIAVEFVDTRRVREIAPALAPSIVAGAYTADDGQADPRATTRAFASAAIACGSVFIRRRIDGFVRGGDRVMGVVAGRETLLATTTVLAAGSWSMRLAAELGLALPVKVRSYQMLLTTMCGPTLAPTITAVDRALSLKQLADGSVLIGGGVARRGRRGQAHGACTEIKRTRKLGRRGRDRSRDSEDIARTKLVWSRRRQF